MKVARWNRQRTFINVYGEVDGVRIKVRVMPDGKIITAHPIDGTSVTQATLNRDGSLTRKDVPYGSSSEVSWEA